MNRREFLAVSALAPWALAALELRVNELAVLSRNGCGRATGYAETNRIVTSGHYTHVAWLDSVKGSFRVRIRTIDRRTGKWSPVYTVGEAHDNHGGPALTIDSKGHLHIIYYPHHHPFRHRVSKRPNDASEWDKEIQFGEKLTYPTLLCGKDNTLYLTARRNHNDQPWEVELWTQPPGGKWKMQSAILRSRHKGYAHFQESLVWGKDGRTLHLSCRFHEHSDKQAYGRLQTVAYLKSPDLGRTWQKADGSVVKTPATAETADVLASGGVSTGLELRAGGMAVDTKGFPALIYHHAANGKRGRTFLARPNAKGQWQRTNLTAFLPATHRNWNLIMPGAVTLNSSGQMFIVAQAHHANSGPGALESVWGHPTTEVVAMSSRDNGRTFRSHILGTPNPKTPHWLPSLERPTGHENFPDAPSVIYTRGTRGAANKDILNNEVVWVAPW